MATSLRSTRTRVGALVVTLAIVVAVLALSRGKQGVEPGVFVTPRVSAEGLTSVTGAAVYFGHQSVGRNILDGVPAVYARAGITSPTVVESAAPPSADAAMAHAYIGQNGDPSSKMTAFDSAIRSGYGDWADAAFMKLCYLDVDAGTDVDGVFSEYKAMMAELERDYPNVDFLHLTVPLTTQPDFVTRLKNIVGKGWDHRADNVAREQYNAMVRAEYGSTGRLVDVAAWESTTPDGERVSGSNGGQPYYALFGGYASDSGHLNPAGAEAVAAGVLEVLSRSLEG